jgi:hypothetical protein
MNCPNKLICKVIAFVVAFVMVTPVSLSFTGDDLSYIDYPPTVKVNTPSSENQIYSGTISIDWLATDAEEDNATLDIAIMYSPDGGTNWVVIMSGVNNNYPPYSWDTIGAGISDGVCYMFKIVASDNKPQSSYGLSRLFSIDNTANDRWYLQIESFNLGTNLDLDMKPSESTSQGISVYVPSPGDIPVQSFASEYEAHCNVDLAGDWVFLVYAKVSSNYADGNLYASVYADNGTMPRLLFTTDYDNETVGSYSSYHEFYWVYSVPPNTLIHAREHVIVEIVLHATAGSGPSTHYNYANADRLVNGTLSGNYTKTFISDYQFETIEEIQRYNGTNATFTILDEDFSGGIPSNWTVIDGGSVNNDSQAPSTWTTENPGNRPAPPPIEEPFAIVDAYINSPNIMNEELITPILNLSFAAFVTLEFDQWFCVYNENNQSIPDRYGITIGDVEVNSSLTGGSWQKVLRNRYNQSLDHYDINITNIAAGSPNVSIRFHYFFYGNQTHRGLFWEVDHILVQAYSTMTILEHKWTIDIPTGKDPYEFSLEARRPDNPDNNNFTFAYSTDDVNYMDMVTVDSPIKIGQRYSLPPGLSATVYIRVVDSDRTMGNIDLSRIEIDEMFISSFNANANIITHNIYPNADIPVVGNVTGNYTQTFVSDNLYETIDEINEEENVLITIIEEDFYLGIPFSDGWQVIDGGQGGGPAKTWSSHNPGNRPEYPPMIVEPFAIADSLRSGNDMDEELITPVLDFSTVTAARLTFDDNFTGVPPGSAPHDPVDMGYVDIRSSLTNGTWHNLIFHNKTPSVALPIHYNIPISPWAAGANDVEIRFHYLTYANVGWWQVDNLKIDGFVNFPISMMEHKWTIDIPGDEAPYIFSVEARRPSSFDQDDFIFSYSTDDFNYKDMVTAYMPDVIETYTYSLPPGLSGTVYIRVIDSDRTLGNGAISRIEIDEMFISSVIASRITIGLDHQTTPSYVEPVLTLGPIEHLCIQDAPGGTGTNVTTYNMTTDEKLTVWSIGYDAEWNYISDIPTNWTNTLNAQTATTSTAFTLDPTAPGVGTITAVYNTTLSDSTGLITVTIGRLADIIIRDSPGGLGDVIGVYSMSTDDKLSVWAAGYDADGNYINDVACNWSTSGTLDAQNADVVNNFTFDPSTAGTSGFILAFDGSLLGSTGLITVSVGALNYVIIRIAPEGAGSEVGDVLMILGRALTVYSAGYDAENNYIGDIPCNWTTTGTLNFTTATTSSSFTFEPAAAGENGTINVIFNGTISDETGMITVTEFAIDYIVIEDGLGNEVTTHTMTVEESFTVWAIGYNLSAGAIGPVNANWTTTGTLDPQTATFSQPFSFDPIHAPTNGTLEAVYELLWDTTGIITVNHGSLTNLCVQNAPNGSGANVTTHTMTTDETFNVWSIGYDAEWNYIGEINCNWTTTGILDLQTATGVDTFTFSPTTTGMGTIVADDLAGHMDSTGLITVSTGAVSYILIRNSPGGMGNVVGVYSMTTDDALTVWAAGYDADGNYISDMACNWSTSSTLDAQNANIVNNFTFDPSTASTSGYIIAVNGSFSDSAGLITVGIGALNHIAIEYAPGGAGSEVTCVLIVIGGALTVYSAGYDADNNYIGDFTCNWSTTGTLNSTNGMSTSFTFVPAVAGETGSINATYNGTISDETGTITVTDHGVDLIVIVNDLGQPVNNYWMDVTQTLRVWAMGWNISVGPICPVAADWITTGTLDFQTATASPSFTFTPIHAPTSGKIEAAFGSLWDSTLTINVNFGPLTFIFIEDAPGGTGTKVTTHTMTTDEMFTVWSIGYDAKGNYIGGVNCNWTTTGTLNPQTATGVKKFTFSPSTVGVGTIVANDPASHIDSTGLITVNTGVVSYILIRDGLGGSGNVVDTYSMATDDMLTVWTASYDAEGNYISDMQCNWFTNGTLDAQSANDVISFTFAPSTDGTSGYIIAVNGTFSDSAGLITVGKVDLNYVKIRDAPGGAGSEVGNVLMTMGETLTLYSACYDINYNYLRDIPCNWTTTGTLNLTTATSSSSFTFVPATAGETGTINASYNDTISDETGTIDVTSYGIDFIVVVDDMYQPINLYNIDTTDTLRVWAMGWNIKAGPVATVPADWTTTGTLDLQTATDSPSFTFAPVHAPTNGKIEASFESLWDYTQVFVGLGPIANVCIQDAPGSSGMNITTHAMTTVETFTVWSNGYDADWNYIGNVVCNWATTGTLNPQTAIGVKSFTFSPANPGTGLIVADYNATIGDATDLITVTYPTFDIDITPAAGSDGWILVSFPSQIEGDPLIIITDAVDEGAGLVIWDIVQWYDPTSPPGTEWKTTATFKPPILNTFNYVNNTYSFWIHISSYGDGILSIEGALPSTGEFSIIPLYAGWNLVGYPSLTQKSVSDAFIGTGYDIAEGYDASDPYRTSVLPGSYMMKPGEGYWVHVPADTVWVIDW